MAVVMALFWGSVIVLILAAIRRRFPRPGTQLAWLHHTERLLAQRLARGEIDETEYRRRLAMLREGS